MADGGASTACECADTSLPSGRGQDPTLSSLVAQRLKRLPAMQETGFDP